MRSAIFTSSSSVLALSLLAGAAHGASAVSESSGITADEARALVAEMLADTERRSSLMDSDTPSDLDVWGFIQMRYYANFRDDNDNNDDGVSEDSFDNGFQFGTVGMNVTGTVGDEGEISYLVQGLYGVDDGVFRLDDLNVSYMIDDNWKVYGGQVPIPLLRELLLDDIYQLAVDRSLVFANTAFVLTQGVGLEYNDDNLRVWTLFSEGVGSTNTSFTDNATLPFEAGESDYAISVRGEYKGAGEWERFNDFTSFRGEDTAWMIGAAAHYEGGDPTASNDYEGFAWTTDATLEGDGWNAFASYAGFYTDVNGGATNTDHTFLVQGGVFIPDTEWEIFGRYDAIYAGDNRTNDDTFNTVTVGANHYIHGHAAKFTVDVQYSFDAATDNDVVGTQERFGFIGDDDEGEFTLRAQFQLIF